LFRGAPADINDKRAISESFTSKENDELFNQSYTAPLIALNLSNDTLPYQQSYRKRGGSTEDD
jgi:hypothetical protein